MGFYQFDAVGRSWETQGDWVWTIGYTHEPGATLLVLPGSWIVDLLV